MKEEKEPTISDVLDAVNSFATRVEERFGMVDARFDQVDTRLDQVDARIDKVDIKIEKLDIKIDKVEENLTDRIDKMETRLVTKAYLDQKLAETTAEIGDRINRRYELDKAFKETVVSILQRNSLITPQELSQLKELI